MKNLDKIKKFCNENRYEIAMGAKLTVCTAGALFGAYKLGTLQNAELVRHGAAFKYFVNSAHHTDQAVSFVWDFPDLAEGVVFSIQKVK